MVKIFYILKRVNKGKIGDLPKHIVEHCNKFHHDDELITSLFTYSLLSELLTKFNRNINELSFSSNGKPIIPNGYISVSHSRNYSLVSYSDIVHGIDIEKECGRRNVVKLMSKYFLNQYEELSFEGLEKEQQKSIFYSLWTKKEAFVKMNDGNILIRDEKFLNENIRYITFEKDGYNISVCAKNEFIIENMS